jgi:hypothetical protein
LGDVFGDLVRDEPPLGLAVDDLVVRGRQRRVRHRRTVAAVAVAATLSVLGLGAVVVANRPAPGPPPVIVGSPTVEATTTPPPPASGSPAPSATGSGTQSSRPAGTGSGPPVGGSSASSENRLSDPGFEASPLTWDKFGAATVVTVTTDTVHSGRQAARVVTTSETPVTAGVISRPVLVVTAVGVRYTATCWVRATRSVLVYAQVQEYTPSWVKVADPAKSPRLTLDDPERWYQTTVTYTATTTGNQLPLSVFGNAMTAGGATLFVDDCSLRSG